MRLKLITINNKIHKKAGIIYWASLFIIFKIKYDLITMLFIKNNIGYFISIIFRYLIFLI